MFTPDPFDIAPAARRPTRMAWMLLALTVGFAAVAATVLERSLDALQQAQNAAAAKEEARSAKLRRDAATRDQANDPGKLEKLRAQQQLQRMLRMSWTGLFDALEHASRAVDGRVTITSLAPDKTQADAAEVNIVGLALTNDALLEYIEALQGEKQVKEVVLTSQQLAQNATRFHLSLVWEPG